MHATTIQVTHKEKKMQNKKYSYNLSNVAETFPI